MRDVRVQEGGPHDPVDPPGFPGLNAMALKPVIEGHGVDDLDRPGEDEREHEQAHGSPRCTSHPRHGLRIGHPLTIWPGASQSGPGVGSRCASPPDSGCPRARAGRH